MKTTKILSNHSYMKAQNPLFYLSRPQQSRRFSFLNPDRTSRLLDRRLAGLGHLIKDEYANIRDSYLKPKHPIVLAHGLLGFDELRIAKRALPAIHYWRGIKDAYSINGVEVITAPVSPSASIEQRAEQLLQGIENRAEGRKVNIIANFVLSGLDARYMISKLRPTTFEVVSLTTIATPHQGSAVADYILEWLGEERLSQLYFILGRLGLENGAFKQLTRKYLAHTFNPDVVNVDSVKYYSYGAVLSPDTWLMFSQSRRILDNEEGPNDGLVSVASSKWGCYKGTLVDVSHIDLINWTNRLKWFAAEITGNRKKFNAVAFYLDIADMLAKEGL
ncbi:Triacylglycerol lipase [Trichophyton interdigitale]|uniref:Triacylglycerol lipase n=1 Tax=Trichophyton interdigitale TaxID=101480 RepID=A0A9P4YFM3_9EURO|nr:Triacylglycerol lipase [Trichophyton interdigitale]KAF3892854.1 Triacylglycerol lipase [Trichophyton interdigitale]